MAREHIKGTPYFFDRRADGIRRIYREETRQRGGGDGKVVYNVLFEVYQHRDSKTGKVDGIFELPTNEFDGRSAISRTQNYTDGSSGNLYLAKRQDYATDESDVRSAMKAGEEAKALTLVARALRKPGAAAKAQGQEMAAAMGPAIVASILEMQKAGLVPKNGGAK
jgi:hypothetical protein